MATKDNNIQVSTSPEVRIHPSVNIYNVHNPRFHLIDLISTRRRPFASTHNPPRPPNSFFLMKNCYLLELRLQGIRLAMPDLCKQAKKIWREIPQETKDRYDSLALQAQVLHHHIYPNYRFTPKKRTKFKPYIPMENHSGMGAFPATNGYLDGNTSPSSSSSSSSPTPMEKSPQLSDLYIVQEPDKEFQFAMQNNFFQEENERVSNNEEFSTITPGFYFYNNLFLENGFDITSELSELSELDNSNFQYTQQYINNTQYTPHYNTFNTQHFTQHQGY